MKLEQKISIFIRYLPSHRYFPFFLLTVWHMFMPFERSYQ
jgi:hypothetical protein